LRRKFGFFTEHEDDIPLAQDLMVAMRDQKADFTLTFRALCDASANGDWDFAVERLFNDPTAVREWLPRWRARLAAEPPAPDRRAAMRTVNAAFIPRNHRVEAVIRAAVDEDDFAPFEELLSILSRPYEDQPEFAQYMQPPHENQRVLQTFCGT
ncbi:MAG TPA: protein adenylyltransferase SelO family protein, partial [Thermoanaerobaculia bacterium]